VHHNFDDSDSGYDVDMENKSKPFGIGGYKGRIIFLGDGTEVLTDSDDTEMFDNSEEDKDLASQVSKNSTAEEGDESSGPPPKAPSPPPRGAKKDEETSQAKSDDSTKKDTPAEVLADAVKQDSKDDTKAEDTSKA
jgi:protein phosphatase 2C family protein 2/3